MMNMNQVSLTNFRSLSLFNACRCGNIYSIFGQIHHVNVRRCQLFGYVQQFWSYSFGHLDPVKRIPLFRNQVKFIRENTAIIHFKNNLIGSISLACHFMVVFLNFYIGIDGKPIVWYSSVVYTDNNSDKRALLTN